MCTLSQRILLLLVALPLSSPAGADYARVPMSIHTGVVESNLRQHVFTGARGTVRINDDGTGCQFLELGNPRLSSQGGRLLLRTDAWARVGRPVAGQCLLAMDWRGGIEFTQVAVLGPDRKSVLVRTSTWRALRADGSTDTLSTTVGRWLDQFLPSGLKETRVDFAGPIGQLQEFLALMLEEDGNLTGAARLNDVRVDSVAVDNDAIGVTIGIDYVPVASAATGPEPVLSEAEIARLERHLDEVDAFFTYTVKTMARSTGDADTTPLLDVLVELRRELISILAEEGRQSGDPARQLFLDAWAGLTPLLADLAAGQPDQAAALRYLTFIGAGDALRALDTLGPAAGIEVSSSGLRRLARILLPDDPADPLQHDDGVDPELRRSFGFGAPLPPPQYEFETSWIDWLIPSAVAATGFDPGVARRLNNWVPKPKDMTDYLPLVQKVLNHAVTEQLITNPLESRYHQVYRWLVFTAAWQESCWRQFTVSRDKRVPVQSGSGDVGMMQINPKVWRGFYDLQGLRWDIVYNARAGADILEHHLKRYAIATGEEKKTGSADSLARATYAAYNGGPRQYDRYRRSNAPADARKIDGLFYEKYQAVKRQGELAVRACYGG